MPDVFLYGEICVPPTLFIILLRNRNYGFQPYIFGTYDVFVEYFLRRNYDLCILEKTWHCLLSVQAQTQGAIGWICESYRQYVVKNRKVMKFCTMILQNLLVLDL